MANLTLSVAPGYYLEAQNASWVLGEKVDFVSFTKDGPSPAISKYIAYDTLVPPNPFIAAAQDGNGNVVYDGGFPKFYNVVAPEAGIDSLFSMEYKGGQLYDIVVDVSTNKVYRYSNGGWSVLTGLKAQDVFGAPRTMVNTETGASFHLNADGTITAL